MITVDSAVEKGSEFTVTNLIEPKLDKESQIVLDIPEHPSSLLEKQKGNDSSLL
jgi:hypothetical protein